MAETATKTNVQYLDMDGLQLYDSLIKAKIANDIKASAYDDTALKVKVTANENAITVLNGEGEGSVKKQVDDAVAKIIADAPEAYDTLKEISDWISSHADSASAMNSQISTNKTDITTLKALIGELPESAESTTIVNYIAEAIGASQSDLTDAIATAKAEAISTAASDATTKADKALSDAKEYVDAQIKDLTDGQIETNKNNIEDLRGKVESLEGATYTPITEEEINALFAEAPEE